MVTLRFEGAGFESFEMLLDRFRQNLDDAEPAFEKMAAYQVEKVNARIFDGQGSPEVGRWAPLSRDYGRWKARVRPGAPLLVFDGDLRDSMTRKGAGVYEVHGRGFVVGTAVPYAIFHQEGTSTMPARPLIGKFNEQDEAAFARILQEFVVEGT